MEPSYFNANQLKREFKSFHGFLKISGGQGEAYFALTDVAAVIDDDTGADDFDAPRVGMTFEEHSECFHH